MNKLFKETVEEVGIDSNRIDWASDRKYGSREEVEELKENQTEEHRDYLREWVKSLRSGKYRQTTGFLKTINNGDKEDGFCCLGVACDISGIGQWENPPRGFDFYCTEDDTLNTFPPAEVLHQFVPESQVSNLSYVLEFLAHQLNDGLVSCSFEEIADFIECLFELS